MKLGFDARCLIGQQTGVGRYLSNLVSNMLITEDRKNDYILYVSDSDNNQMFKHNSSILMKELKSPTLLWKHIRLPISLAIDKVDLVHSPSYTAPLMTSCKSVVTIHDVIYANHPEWCSKRQYLRFKHLVRIAAKYSDAVIVDSNATRREVLHLTEVPEHKIHVIYLAADSIYHPIKDENKYEYLQDKYKFKGNYVLFVGSIHPRRNIHRFLKAFSILKKEKQIPHKILLTGLVLDYNKELGNLIESLNLIDCVKQLGFIPDEDLIGLYSFADLFIYPSLYEGFGLPVIEAMACGTPVITSNISSLPEVSGDAAVLVDPYNIQEMAEAMGNILSSSTLREKLIEKGFERVKHFHWEKTAKETLNVYNQVLKNT
tara:strand:- start:837 stop:1955 length:1119 start_codon:yes stop_codon:yes gene_type:complete